MAQKKITILDEAYTLPAVTTPKFQALQAEILSRQEIIKTGQRPRFMGLSSRTVTPEERWKELGFLTQNYNGIIEELTASQTVYRKFFGDLAAGVQKALMHRSANLQNLEEERLADAQDPNTLQDPTLQEAVQKDGELLLQATLLLGKGSLLILKKISLCEEGLIHLVEDQELQRKLLEDLTSRISGHQRAYIRRQKITAALEDAARVAEVALHFEEVLRDHLGPLQGLLEHVARIDGGLHTSVAEIEDLTRQLMQQQLMSSLPESEALDERWMGFLTAGQLKKERLAEIWQRMERQDGQMEALDVEIAAADQSDAPSPVLTALTNIRMLVDERLVPVMAASTPVMSAVAKSEVTGKGLVTRAVLATRKSATDVVGGYRVMVSEGAVRRRIHKGQMHDAYAALSDLTPDIQTIVLAQPNILCEFLQIVRKTSEETTIGNLAPAVEIILLIHSLSHEQKTRVLAMDGVIYELVLIKEALSKVSWGSDYISQWFVARLGAVNQLLNEYLPKYR